MEALNLKAHADTGNLTIPFAPYLEAGKRFAEQCKAQDYFMENLMVSIFFHLHMPNMTSQEDLWKCYVNFCNLYAFYHFMAVMSYRKEGLDHQAELFRLIVFASRSLIHNGQRQNRLRDELFQNDSASLAHMAILLSGPQRIK